MEHRDLSTSFERRVTGLLYTMPKSDGQSVERNLVEQSALLLRGQERIIRLYASFRVVMAGTSPSLDIYSVLHTRSGLSRKDVRLYAVEFLLATEAIHKLGVIH
ncbi:hypothetical protein BC826DRAFT_324190 [Russula brevipes]|nr:hypothetical protein BC826DRAFT_324190 [Russula brevipes]